MAKSLRASLSCQLRDPLNHSNGHGYFDHLMGHPDQMAFHACKEGKKKLNFQLGLLAFFYFNIFHKVREIEIGISLKKSRPLKYFVIYFQILYVPVRTFFSTFTFAFNPE